ncbi:protein takeout-like [Onthophagus taurus]|uniref:protein takeout-like n=1 Tax=Onthophagus taurus TaxID=166361 RepID=UPI0039BE897B
MKNIFCYFIFFSFINLTFSQIPSFLKICHRHDPNLEDCIKKSVEQLRPKLSEGIPEFDIPSCEPLYVPEVVIDQGNGPLSIKSDYTNIKVYGPSEFELKSVRVDLDKDRVKLKVKLPRLELTSDYSMNGKILMMPISGSGTCAGNYSDIDATVLLQGGKIKKGDRTFFSVKDFFVDFTIGHAKLQLNDLFGGDKELGKAMNLFLNDNWKNVADEIKPVLEDTIANMFKKFANKIFHKYPLNVLLPD